MTVYGDYTIRLIPTVSNVHYLVTYVNAVAAYESMS